MLTLGPLAFAAPWLLAGLIALPAIWLVIRLIPPAPKRQIFPALRLLLGLEVTEETAARTPWWLILLRLALAALVILGLAQPLLNPADRMVGSGPVLLVIDDGWAAAPNWSERREVLFAALEQAEREGRPAALLTTARSPGNDAPSLFGPRRASEIRERLQGLEPKPWPADRAAALSALNTMTVNGASPSTVVADGLEDPAWRPLLEKLQSIGPVKLHTPGTADLPMLLMPPENGAQAMRLTVRRADASAPAAMGIRALGPEGRLIARPILTFAAGETEARYDLALPAEARNILQRLDLDQPSHIGGTVLADERWRRRPVGIVTGSALDQSQSLLQDGYYLERALQPFAEMRRGALSELLKSPPSLILLSDAEPVSDEARGALEKYIQGGGVLVRFAGSKLAAGEDDTLLPVRLRQGGRSLGTALQWTTPEPLAAFSPKSPFAGLAIPKDVTVSRQVLAEPGPDLADRSWAQLADGTPLVTGLKEGEGWLVLFHVPASAEWSNLPLSGLFIDMLQRLVALGRGQAGGAADVTLAPIETLDGFARLAPAAANAQAIPAGTKPTIGPAHPPGLYGTPGARQAFGLTHGTVTRVDALSSVPPGIERVTGTAPPEFALRPALLTGAMVLLLIDLIVALALRGLLRPAVTRIAGLLLVIGLVAISPRAEAQDPMEFALRATLETRLAYIETGDATIDEVSKQGLSGLSLALRRRTAIDAAEPMAVNVESDELAFFPLLYWPIAEAQAPLSPNAVERVNFYLRNGGTILFDTRDGGLAEGVEGVGSRRLRALVGALDIPPLTPANTDHVLSKTFYLLQDYPGREVGGELWVQSAGGTDEVSSIILGANDYAAAWATDQTGRPLYPVVPGGERQREMAFRTGVNIVMYALTGNYKSDQVHVPAILERLGQ
ncbi:DUF4159 domain-containing protein [Lacibacterium aquatile]|uniref:DUF4159 domain-containing protein n=1 Tax=Lacibacterium aquatile TaxID=1168082 RepID=A0ABW5DWG3_9PROT